MTISRLSIVLTLGLVGSAALNCYLLLDSYARRGDARRSPSRAPVASRQDVAIDPCRHQLWSDAVALSVARRGLEAKMTLEERFAQGGPDASSEARLADFLDDIFDGELSYAVECRTRVCKLEVEGDDFSWMDGFQAYAVQRALFDASAYGGPVAYVSFREEEIRRGVLLRRRVISQLHASSAVIRCRKSPPVGDLRLVIDVTDGPAFETSYIGTLVGTVTEACFRTAIDHELGTIDISRDTVWPVEQGPVDLLP